MTEPEIECTFISPGEESDAEPFYARRNFSCASFDRDVGAFLKAVPVPKRGTAVGDVTCGVNCVMGGVALDLGASSEVILSFGPGATSAWGSSADLPVGSQRTVTETNAGGANIAAPDKTVVVLDGERVIGGEAMTVTDFSSSVLTTVGKKVKIEDLPQGSRCTVAQPTAVLSTNTFDADGVTLNPKSLPRDCRLPGTGQRVLWARGLVLGLGVTLLALRRRRSGDRVAGAADYTEV